jgi:hypothetical protein
MAEVTANANVIIMANADTYSPLSKKIKIKGVRLVGGSANATATLTINSKVIYSLAAIIGTVDESCIPMNVEGGTITAALAGTGASLYVYLE